MVHQSTEKAFNSYFSAIDAQHYMAIMNKVKYIRFSKNKGIGISKCLHLCFLIAHIYIYPSQYIYSFCSPKPSENSRLFKMSDEYVQRQVQLGKIKKAK